LVRRWRPRVSMLLDKRSGQGDGQALSALVGNPNPQAFP
jgi:hypothetical protein